MLGGFCNEILISRDYKALLLLVVVVQKDSVDVQDSESMLNQLSKSHVFPAGFKASSTNTAKKYFSLLSVMMPPACSAGMSLL